MVFPCMQCRKFLFFSTANLVVNIDLKLVFSHYFAPLDRDGVKAYFYNRQGNRT